MKKKDRTSRETPATESVLSKVASKDQLLFDKKLSRRDMLRLTGASGLGLLLGGGGVGSILAARKAAGQPGQALSSRNTRERTLFHSTGIIRRESLRLRRISCASPRLI